MIVHYYIIISIILYYNINIILCKRPFFICIFLYFHLKIVMSTSSSETYNIRKGKKPATQKTQTRIVHCAANLESCVDCNAEE